MKIASIVGLVVGLAVLAGLIVWQGIADVAALLLASDWKLLLVPLIWLPTLFMNARSWQLLFLPREAPGFWATFLAQWMGRAVNALLPVASIGGEIVKARAVVLWGAHSHHASGATVVDKTVQVVTSVLWGLIGVSLLAWMTLDNAMVVSASIAIGLLAVGAVGFFIVQRRGIFRMAVSSAHRVTKSDFVGGLAGAATEIDIIINHTYARRRRLAAATAWRMAALVLQTGEVWLAALLLGHPISVVEALLLKSLTSTVSDAAFVVPNSYGVQEGAFVILGTFVGWPPEVGLAVSLVVRIREIVIDVPALLLWHQVEGKALVARRRRRAAQANDRV